MLLSGFNQSHMQCVSQFQMEMYEPSFHECHAGNFTLDLLFLYSWFLTETWCVSNVMSPAIIGNIYSHALMKLL